MIHLTTPMSTKMGNGDTAVQSCLKIENNKGDELSVAFDNSCGAASTLCRSYAVIFRKDGTQTEQVEALDAEKLYALLGELLGK